VIAVVGATGFVGRHVVARLAASKTPVRAVSRTPGPGNAAVQAAAADLLHPSSLAVALTGVETIVHCAAITADKKEAYRGQYHDVNAKGTRNLVDAAREAGVRRIVLLNGLGTRPGSEGSYMRTRWEMAEAVRGIGLSWTALQPSILFGDSAPFPAAIARLARQFPVVPVLGGGRKLQPLWIEDLVTCLIQSVNDPRRDGQTIDLGGPEQMTFAEIDVLILETIKVRRLKLPLPVPMARIAAGVMSVLPNPPLVPATLELFDFDNTTDLDAVSRNFGFEPRSIRTHFKEHGLDG
jgi:NADH dehydrogenase